jgi:hypothetical protein
MNRSFKVLLVLAGLGGAAVAARAASLYALGKGVQFVGRFEGSVHDLSRLEPFVVDEVNVIDVRDGALAGYPSSN